MTNNKQSSSVDWLISQLQKSKDWHRVLNEVSQMSSVRVDIIAEAKAMHKDEIERAFNEGENNSVDYFNPENRIKECEQYYNETFNNEQTN